jgi:hypothetical protein
MVDFQSPVEQEYFFVGFPNIEYDYNLFVHFFSA